MSKFVTEKMTVSFAYLNKPDDKFGADAANFNITVPLESKLSDQIKSSVSKTGAKKVNGVYEKDGEKFIKFKNRILVRDGVRSFPCVDSKNNPTTVTASGGDVVRLLLSPSLIKRDNSLSVYLDGVQIIEKNSMYGTGNLGFDEVEGGFVQEEGSKFEPENNATEENQNDVVADEDGDDDLPF
ncbi:MAG: hypothetical protein CMA63_06225 [Euryarchaeota archaeon]|jgi:hypothetical protein|nr:hypothetical protein [Euryarchaeota archaeon]|tara:strand:+ start:13069 stop:13617 length:549 start_codon:yes stop_codon:yes gene_type:complete